MIYLKSLNIKEIDKVVTEEILGIQKSDSESKINFRSKQIARWVYNKYIDDPEKFTDISRQLREKIKQKFIFRSLYLYTYQVSKISSSIKFAFKTKDNEVVESILMKHPDRYTLCLSSQIGCNVGCIFCASGKDKLRRNLDTAEIVDQLFLVSEFIYGSEGKRITNIVFMGMGEPLLNYDNVLKAIDIFTSEWGFNLSKRNITLSTSGILKGIYKLIEDNVRVKLAFSLHSPFQDQREKLVPIAKKYKLNDILKALESYYSKTKRRITIEYVLLREINDSLEHAKALVDLLKNYSMKVFVNLIPYNSIGEVYLDERLLEEPELKRIKDFEEIVKKNFEVSIRWSLGRDIDGACGQLRRKIIQLT